MSRIVKSMAVVDDRPQENRFRAFANELLHTDLTVIKPQAVATNGQGIPPRQLRNRDSYLDELNRLQLQVEDAKAELRRLRRQMKETKEELEALPDPGEIAIQQEEDPTGKEEAARVIAQAQKEAEKLLEQAAMEAKELTAQAKAEGYKEGYQHGYEDARDGYQAENQPYAEDIQQLVHRLSSFEKERMRQAEAEFVRLCTAIAEKIVGRELKTDPTAIRDMLWEVVEANRREEYIRITLAPDLLPVEMQSNEEVCALLEKMGANVTVLTDKEAQPGTCLVETPVGLTDLSIETQKENLEVVLMGG